MGKSSQFLCCWTSDPTFGSGILVISFFVFSRRKLSCVRLIPRCFLFAIILFCLIFWWSGGCFCYSWHLWFRWGGGALIFLLFSWSLLHVPLAVMSGSIVRCTCAPVCLKISGSGRRGSWSCWNYGRQFGGPFYPLVLPDCFITRGSFSGFLHVVCLIAAILGLFFCLSIFSVLVKVRCQISLIFLHVENSLP